MKNKKWILIASLLVFLTYFKWILPYEHISTDLHKLSIAENIDRINIPQMWTSTGALGLGQYDGFSNWNWPTKFVSSLIMIVVVDSNIVHQLFLFFVFLLIGYSSIYRLSRYLKISHNSSVILGAFYLVNSYILLIVDGGQLLIALSYAMIPLSLLLCKIAIDKFSYQNIAKASLSVVILGFFDIRFIYILFLILSFNYIYTIWIEKNFKITLSWFKVGTLTGLTFIILNFFWLYPFIRTSSTTMPNDLLSTSQLDFLNFTTLGHGLFSQQPHWPTNKFGVTYPVSVIYILIPLISFSAVFYRKRIKDISFWVGLALISIFFVKGSNPPFGDIYIYLFKYLPGFSLFRDSTKFFFILNLSYSILIGFSLDYFSKNKKRYLNFFLILYLLILFTIPANTILNGTFSKSLIESEFSILEEQLKGDKNFSRVLWIPTKSGLSYTSPNKPGIEALRIIDKRPFNTGVIGKYDTLNFIRDSEYMGDIFDIYGIGYISYPVPEFSNLESENYYYIFINQIGNLTWVENKINEKVPTYKLAYNKEKIFTPNSSYLVSGSDSIYSKFIPDNVHLSNSALIFLDEFNLEYNNDFEKIPLVYDDEIDAIVTLSDKRIFPAKDVIQINNDDFWLGYGDLITWRDFLEQKYNLTTQDFYPNGIVVAEGQKYTKVNLNQDGILFARVFKSPLSDSITFVQGENNYVLDTSYEEKIIERTLHGYESIEDQIFKYSESNYYWVQIENIDPVLSFDIETNGEINVINQFAVVQESDLLLAQSIFSEKEKYTYDQVDFVDSATTSAIANYKRISPTEYQIDVSNLKNPQTIVFSENFDINWKLYDGSNSIDPFPVYSGLNGYWITKEGNYRLFYEPQKFVLIPFLISGISFVTLILYIMGYEYRKYKKASSH